MLWSDVGWQNLAFGDTDFRDPDDVRFLPVLFIIPKDKRDPNLVFNEEAPFRRNGDQIPETVELFDESRIPIAIDSSCRTSRVILRVREDFFQDLNKLFSKNEIWRVPNSKYENDSWFLTSCGKSSIEAMVYNTGVKCQMLITKNHREWTQNRFPN